MTPQEKKEYNEVLKKYHRSKGDVFKSYLKKVRTGAILGVGLDLIFTAGFGTVAVATAAALPALKAAFRSAAKRGVLTRHPQQQEIKAGADVMIILADLEYGLTSAYQLLKKPVEQKDPGIKLLLSIEARKTFLALAAQVEEDIRKLSPGIKIISGGGGNYDTDKYVILLREEWGGHTPENFRKLDDVRKTMTDEIASMEKDLAELTRRAKAEAEAAANPPKKKPTGFRL